MSRLLVVYFSIAALLGHSLTAGPNTWISLAARSIHARAVTVAPRIFAAYIHL